jgi:hypothetical protein
MQQVRAERERGTGREGGRRRDATSAAGGREGGGEGGGARGKKKSMCRTDGCVEEEKEG